MVKKVSYWLYTFLGLHLVVWTLAPCLVRYNLPMDAVEGSIWGHQLVWGYDKNPFVNAWLTELAIKLGGQSGWMTYLFCQLSVIACFWAVWQLGKKILPPLYALIAVLLLEGIQYYNFHAIDFNDNTLELGLWAFTILFFYEAAQKKNLLYWVLTGFAAGISMMTKYYTVVLLLPMLGFLIIDKDARKNFKTPAFYVGLGVFSLVMVPHIIWLFKHNFITVHYALNRVSSPPTWWSHLFFAGQFSWQIFETFLPAGLLFSLLIYGKFIQDPAAASKDTANPELIDHEENILYLKKTDELFLLLMGLGPFLLTVLLSAISGLKLRAGWGQPLLSMWGLLLLAYLRPTITPKQFYRFISVLFLTLIIAVTGYCFALTRAAKPSSANFPGKEIALTLTDTWHEKFKSKVPYVAGIRWLAGNVALYSPDDPAVYIDWNKRVSSWIDENKLRQTGAIFVWDLSEHDNVPFREIKKRFPEIGQPQLMRFAWLRNKNMPDVKIMVAFLPPEESHV